MSNVWETYISLLIMLHESLENVWKMNLKRILIIYIYTPLSTPLLSFFHVDVLVLIGLAHNCHLQAPTLDNQVGQLRGVLSEGSQGAGICARSKLPKLGMVIPP